MKVFVMISKLFTFVKVNNLETANLIYLRTLRRCKFPLYMPPLLMFAHEHGGIQELFLIT